MEQWAEITFLQWWFIGSASLLLTWITTGGWADDKK